MLTGKDVFLSDRSTGKFKNITDNVHIVMLTYVKNCQGTTKSPSAGGN